LSGTPRNSDVGSYWLIVKVIDGDGGIAENAFTLRVYNINDAPEITTVDVTTATEDETFSVDYDAEDIDPTGDELTWSLSTDAEFLSINPSTGVLSGTPDNEDVGSFSVIVTVSDGNGGLTNTIFTLMVENVNDRPTISGTNIVTAVEDSEYYVDYDADDIDPTGDLLIWILNSNAGWLILDPVTGELRGIPNNDDVGSYWVNVSVSDGMGGLTSTIFTLTVENVNDRPTISGIDLITALEDTEYYVDYDADDIDPTNDLLVWILNTNADWLKLNPATGELTGIPDNADVGSYWVKVTVSDGKGGFANRDFKLTVSDINDAPVITTTNVVTTLEDEFYSVDYDATDVDSPLADQFWRLTTDAEWLYIDEQTGVLSGTPSNDDVGTFRVEITVFDGEGGLHYIDFTILVLNVNDDPIITSSDKTTAEEGVEYRVDYEAVDIDPTDEVLTWRLDTNASFLKIDPTTGVLSGTPEASDAGSYWVEVTVYDGNGGSDSHKFTIIVDPKPVPSEEPNKPPILFKGTLIPNSGDTDTEFTFSVHYTDIDGDEPEGVYVVIDGENYQMHPAEGEDSSDGLYVLNIKLPEGDHTYYFKASDGETDALSGDDTISTSPDNAISAPKVTNTETTKSAETSTNWFLYLLLILIIIVIVVIAAVLASREKKETPRDNMPPPAVRAAPGTGPPVMRKPRRPSYPKAVSAVSRRAPPVVKKPKRSSPPPTVRAAPRRAPPVRRNPKPQSARAVPRRAPPVVRMPKPVVVRTELTRTTLVIRMTKPPAVRVRPEKIRRKR
jgi:hypothetical protein